MCSCWKKFFHPVDPITGDSIDNEEYRLGGRGPVVTVIYFAIGPLLSLVSHSIFGILESYYVNKKYGKDGLSAMGVVFVLQYLIHGFTLFMRTSIDAKVSYLHGNKSAIKISETTFDLLRMSVIAALIIPIFSLPSAKPLMKWLHVSAKSQENGFNYLLPVSTMWITEAVYTWMCGLCISNGHTILYGIIHVCRNCLCVLIVEPIFIFLIGTNIFYVSFSRQLSNLLAVCCFSYYLYKKQILKFPKNYKIFGRFTSESISAMKIGLSALVMQTGLIIPSALMQKYLSLAAKKAGASSDVMGVWHIMAKVYDTSTSVTEAMVIGFIPTTAYAYGAMMPKRIFSMCTTVFVISVIWASICVIAFGVFPKEVCKLWTSDISFSGWLEKMIPPSIWTAPLCPLKFIVMGLLQATKRSLQASILSIISYFVALPVISSIIYYALDGNPVDIVYSYIFTDSFGFIVSVFFSIAPVIEIAKLIKKDQTESINTPIDKTNDSDQSD